MVRKQVLVQLDDELVSQLDEVAARLEISRSELLRRGAQAVLEADRAAIADRALVAAYSRTPLDPVLIEAATRLAAETAPEW
jgi:metal-responsive CopG/Arc/MetJ family transcriptional regulator